MGLEGTILVKYRAGSIKGDYLFNIDIDDILNVDEVGDSKSSFGPGDQVYIAVNHSTNVIIDEVVSTDGSVQYIGSESRNKIDTTLFAGREAEDLDKYEFDVVPSKYTIKYLGRAGSVTPAADPIGRVSLTGDADKAPFMASIDTEYAVKVYRLSVPEMELEEDESYPIGIVFYISLV